MPHLRCVAHPGARRAQASGGGRGDRGTARTRLCAGPPARTPDGRRTRRRRRRRRAPVRGPGRRPRQGQRPRPVHPAGRDAPFPRPARQRDAGAAPAGGAGRGGAQAGQWLGLCARSRAHPGRELCLPPRAGTADPAATRLPAGPRLGAESARRTSEATPQGLARRRRRALSRRQCRLPCATGAKAPATAPC